MQNSPGRWGRPQAARAIGGALATGVVALAVGAATAGAAVTAVGGGTLDWGTKQSFRNYVEGPIAHGEITTAGGATRNADGTFRWPVIGGQFDAAAETGEVRSAGTARFYGHNGMLELEITNPRLVIAGENGVVHADVHSRSLSSGQMESFPNVDLASLDLSAIEPVADASGFSYAAVPAVLTANGAPAFAGFYAAGTELDPVTVAATYGSAPTDPPAQPGVGPEIRAAGKPQKLNQDREARIARIRCNTGPCALDAPAKVKAKIAGAQYKAKVLAPSSVAAGATAKVSVKLGRKAAKALSGARTKVKVPITATAPQTGAYAQAIEVSERAKVEIKGAK